jgi:DNA-binding GntR family transcriptional regulator
MTGSTRGRSDAAGTKSEADASAGERSGTERIPGHTANARAYALLKEAVLSGRFPPGQVITLRSVNELLGLGEMAAREALKRLIAEGGFKAMPNRSARVPVLNRREITQICELRYLLESNAAALAAENITLHQIGQLRSLHDLMLSAVRLGDLVEYKRLNMAFHFEIYRIADNEPLSSLIESLWLRMAPFISRTINWANAIPGRFDVVANSHHDELLSAFQRRDAEAARLAMRRDLSDIHEIDGYWEFLGNAALVP